MKKLFLILISIVTPILNNAQTTTSLSWAKFFNGSGSDESHSICTDVSGNIYTAGTFWHIDDFDPSAGTYTLDGGFGGNGFVSKLDASGNFVWAKKIGGVSNDAVRANSMAFDALGNIYITGHFKGTIDFDPSVGVFSLTSTLPNYYDVFVEKLDPSGNFVWAKSFGGTDVKQGFSVVVDASGNVYTCGEYKGTVDFDPGPGVFNLTSLGLFDAFISKLDPAGNFLWAKSFGGINNVGAKTMLFDALGNIYIAGSFEGTVDVDPSSNILNLSATGFGSYDIFLLMLDNLGNLLWAKNYGGPGQESVNSLKRDVSGNLLMTGVFTNQTDLDPSPSIYNLNSSGAADVYVLKLNPSGNFIWAKRVGGALDEFAPDIAIDNVGDLYITGSFLSTVADFDPGLGVFNLLTPSGVYSMFLFKLDILGNFVWAKSAGAINCYAKGSCITTDSQGNIITTGEFSGTVDFDLDAGTFYLNGGGVFIQKMSQSVMTNSKENISANNISIYPNPTEGLLNIECKILNEKSIKFEIVNVLGQVMISETPFIQNFSFNIQHLPSGLYFLKALSNDKIIANQKIVKE